MLPIISAALPILDKVLDRVIPDEAERAKAKLEMQSELQKNEHAITLAQLEINKADAQSENWFQNSWRPAVGWLGVAGLGWVYLLHPILAWGSINLGWQAPPEIDPTVLVQILMSLLGFGALRTVEKVKKVAGSK